MPDRKKNIAIVTTGIIEEYQDLILNGISSYVQNKEYNFTIFQCLNGGIYKEKYDVGEHNILNLVNFNDFDGAIVIPNTIKYEETFHMIIDKMNNATIPIVTIDYESKNTCFVGNDNYGEMKNIVLHMINTHNCRKINFITGHVHNFEGMARFKAYKDILKESCIEYEEERVFFGQFSYQDGENAVKYFLQSLKELPDAIVCSNDEMALGAFDELMRHGIKVPEDIKITGFDNLKRAELNSVSITSVYRQLDKVGETAARTIIDLINGYDVIKKQYIPAQLVIHKSCGCEDNHSTVNMNNENFTSISLQTEGYLYTSGRMIENINSSRSFNELVDNLKYWISRLKCCEFYVCLCPDWLDNGNITDPDNFNCNYRVYDYSPTMMPVISYKDDVFYDNHEFNTKDLLPNGFDKNNKTKFYIFAPLHFQDRCLGYSVIATNKFSHFNSVIYTLYVVNIINSLEIIRREHQLKVILGHVKKLSISDTLTGILNRNGFLEKVRNIIKNCSNQKHTFMIAYFDLDGLKDINDNFGHEEGDNAIIAIAETLSSCCTGNDLVGRIGGDEFVYFGLDYTKESAECLKNRINAELSQKNKTNNKYILSCSCGHQMFDCTNNIDIKECIDKADSKMYVCKREKHKKNI